MNPWILDELNKKQSPGLRLLTMRVGDVTATFSSSATSKPFLATWWHFFSSLFKQGCRIDHSWQKARAGPPPGGCAPSTSGNLFQFCATIDYQWLGCGLHKTVLGGFPKWKTKPIICGRAKWSSFSYNSVPFEYPLYYSKPTPWIFKKDIFQKNWN